jgi:hypothetical protein
MLGAGRAANADEPLPAAMQDKGILLDRLILNGLEDPTLEFEGANVLLNTGFFGKPLRDVAFGRRTCDGGIPSGNDTRLARTKSASEYAWKIADRVVSSSTEMPASEDFPRQTAASFARLLSEFRDSGDSNAFDGIMSSPELIVFLLDPREAGYCQQVTVGSKEARISRAFEFNRVGIRRLERPGTGEAASVVLYLYRPKRVLDLIQDVAHDPSPTGAQEIRGRLADYAARISPLERFSRIGHIALDPYSFPKTRSRTGNVLDDPRNRLPADLKYELQMNMPIEIGVLRREIAGGNRRPSFNADQWRALELLTGSCLPSDKDFYVLRVVTDPAFTDGRYVGPLGDDRLVGVTIQLAALDRIARLDPKKSGPLRRELNFLCSAVAAIK